MMSLKNYFLATLACAAFIAPAQAYEQGDWILRVGAANVDPDTDSDRIDVAGLATLEGVEVDDNTQLGITVNYTYFWDEDTDKELEGALGVITEPVTGSTDPVPADLSLDDSWGVSARAGFDYTFNERWGLSASVWWIDIDTEATIETELANVKFDVEIDPWVYMLGVSYRF